MAKQVFLFCFLSLSEDEEHFISIYEYLEKVGFIWLTKTTKLDSFKKKGPHDTSCCLNTFLLDAKFTVKVADAKMNVLYD